MRVDVKTQAHQINHNAQTLPGHRAKVIDHKVNPYAEETEVAHDPPKSSTAVLSPPSSSSSPTSTLAHLLSSSRRGPERDREYRLLQKRHSALVLQLSTLSQALHTAQQGLTLQSSSTDVGLETLIRKWRHVSRQAADELFAGAKDRVNRMGGVGAWRERNKKQTQGWDEEELLSHEDLTERQKDLIKDQKDETEVEKRKDTNWKVEDVVEERNDEVCLHSSLSICSRLMIVA
jgi:hypothetical protein